MRLFWLLLVMQLSQAQAQVASLLPNGMQQFADQNGQPYAVGSVYSYIPNTLTPKATWSDPGATVANSNPVVLDSAGRAVIYGNGAYRQILKDVFGNTIWDKLTQGVGGSSVVVNATITGSSTVSLCSGFFPIVNGAAAPIVITMPTSPGNGDACTFSDVGYNAGTYPVTFNFGSAVLASGVSEFFFGFSGQTETFLWNTALAKWIAY